MTDQQTLDAPRPSGGARPRVAAVARAATAPTPGTSRRASSSSSSSSRLVDALGVYGILAACAVQSWGIVAFLVLALVAVNWVYFSKRAVPGKYLIPGLLFLLVYQLFVMAYTGYVAFTNYGDGHNSDQGRRDRGDLDPERDPGRGLADAAR